MKGLRNMAEKITVELVSDLSQRQADGMERVTWGLDGTTYEIDLTGAEAASLRKALAKYKAVSRKKSGSTGGRGRKASGRRSGSASDLNSVREWARANGYQVSDRGRVSNAVMDAYNAAH